MKKIFLISILTLSLAWSCKAQVVKEIDAYLSNTYRTHIMPGFAVVVVDNDGVLYTGSFGYTDIGSKKRFTTSTISPIGSLTKSITTIAILQLVEKGLLSLEDQITKYLPGLTTAIPKISDKITVRMLLNNTSGLVVDVPNSFEMSRELSKR